MLNRRQQALCIAVSVAAGVATAVALVWAICLATPRLIDRKAHR